MEISNINYKSMPADLTPLRVNKSKNSGASEGDSTSPVRAGNVAPAGGQEPNSLSRIDFIKKALDDILINYPPWFPAGAPQRNDLIKKIRDIQEQIGKSPVLDGTVNHLAGNKLSDSASDKEISAVMAGFRSIREAFTHKNASTITGRGNAGPLVNIKV